MKAYHEQTKTRKFRNFTGWLEDKYHRWLQRRAIAHYEWEEHKRDECAEEAEHEKHEEWLEYQTENIRPDNQMEMAPW